MAKISALIPDELGAELERRAREEDRSRGAVVRRALAEHLTAAHEGGSAVGSHADPGPSRAAGRLRTRSPEASR